MTRRWWGAVAPVLGLSLSLWANSAVAASDASLPVAQAEESSSISNPVNHLIDSQDPYLLQHAHNPVDWYPWGPEALAKAKREDKPIFISVGYSTCYWCHVAEQTIYSNHEIAALMNQWFVNIKVDREQRPDLDRFLLLATEQLTGHGGWPNNVFLTPELKPFFAGSYFPPQDGPRGDPGFPTVLNTIQHLWTDHRDDKVRPLAEKIFLAMQREETTADAIAASTIQPDAWLRSAGQTLLQHVDETYGGLGDSQSGSKFPQTPSLELLLAETQANQDYAADAALTASLDAIAYGGIHDHVAGGFHRYATEPTWSIPHFEKMLYDNAQLLRLFAASSKIFKRPLYRAIALESGAFLGQGMMAADGGFYTAIDSQVNGEEGAAALWSRGEVVTLLGEEAAKRFFTVYALTPMPETSTNAARRSGPQDGVLRVRLPIAETIKRAAAADSVQMLAGLASERAKLLAQRRHRLQPSRDEKIMTDLNGLTIAALAESSNLIQQPQFLLWARKAAERIWAQAYTPMTGRLLHEIFQGQAQTEGYLQDYAMLGVGFMALFDATAEPVWRDRSMQLAEAMLVRFARPDGSLSPTALDQYAAPIVVADSEDGDMPSGTSAAIDLLLRLSATTPTDSRYRMAVERLLRHLSGRIEDSPAAWSAAITAIHRHPIAWTQEATGAPETFHVPETKDHVHATAAMRQDGEGDEIVITLKIDDGFHINAHQPSLDYLIPTSVTFDQATPSQVIYPQATRFKAAFTSNALDVYEGNVSLVAKFPKGRMGGPEMHGSLIAQACDAQVCLPPSTLPLSFAAIAE